jgi:hypothetical protein
MRLLSDDPLALLVLTYGAIAAVIILGAALATRVADWWTR